MKAVFKTLVSLLFASVHLSAQAPAQAIPDFTFFRLNEVAFTTKDLAPGKLLLFVFFDTQCDHCQHAVKEINQHYKEYKKVAIYLITLDDQEKLSRFMNKYGQNLKGKGNVTLLQDLRNEFITRFRPKKYPSLFLYSAKKELIMYDDNEQNLFRFSQQINAPG
jgi:cytochrome oxidase Cu insertion factor (SCO1/SenC/PrrC family)